MNDQVDIRAQLEQVVAANHTEQISMYQRIRPAINELCNRLRAAVGKCERQVPSWQAWWRDPQPRLVLDVKGDVLVFQLPGRQDEGSASFHLATVLNVNDNLDAAVDAALGHFVNYKPLIFDTEVAQHIAANERVKIEWHMCTTDNDVLIGKCAVLDYQIRHCADAERPYQVTSRFRDFVCRGTQCEAFETAVQLCYVAQDVAIMHAKQIGNAINLPYYISRH